MPRGECSFGPTTKHIMRRVRRQLREHLAQRRVLSNVGALVSLGDDVAATCGSVHKVKELACIARSEAIQQGAVARREQAS